MYLKYLIILSIFLWCIVYKANGQPWYFNEVFNPNNSWASGLSIIGTEQGYFGCAISNDSISNYYYNACTFLLNPEGELIFWKSYGMIGSDYYPGYYGSLTNTLNDCFALFGSVHNLTTGRSHGLFYKFNAMGDTILTRSYTSETYNRLVGRTCTTTSDSGYALLGELSVNTNYSDLILIKTDAQANEIWRMQYGTSVDDWGISIIQTADKGYVLGGWSYIPGQWKTQDPLVIKVDSLGGFEWTVNLGGPYKDDAAYLCNTKDSCIMVLTAYGDSTYTPQFSYARINLVKIDLQGNIIWNKKYGPSKKVNLVSNIILLDNGDFMACGWASYAAHLPAAGWLFRFSQDGDSLWYRDYWYYPEGPNYGQNYLYDVSQTADNGFVAVGQAYADGYPNNVQKMWVVKVDSLGCLVAGCDTLVGLDEEHGGLAAWGHGGVVVYPNPCRDVLHVSLTSRQSLALPAGRQVDSLQSVGQLGSGQLDRFRIELYDIFGRLVYEASTRMGGGLEGGSNGRGGGKSGRQSWQINVSALPPGIYLAVVRDERALVGSAKLVVAR